MTVIDDRARCWGSNGNGQLGDGTTTARTVPVKVKGRAAFFQWIAAGLAHTCAVNTEDFELGAAFCWGRGDVGQIGDDFFLERHTPTEVEGDPFRISGIAAGFFHACAVTKRRPGENFGVECWGANGVGQLGDGTTKNSAVPRTVRPVFVYRLRSGIIEIALGGSHSCARISRREMKCWGNNANGQLGNGTKAQSSIPVEVNGL